MEPVSNFLLQEQWLLQLSEWDLNHIKVLDVKNDSLWLDFHAECQIPFKVQFIHFFSLRPQKRYGNNVAYVKM